MEHEVTNENKPVTREELHEYAKWQDVWQQLMCVGRRMDRRDNLLGVVTVIALLALGFALAALVQLN